MKEIIDGFLKFQREAFPKREALFKQLATQQSPRTLFISCSDSRLVPELVTQRERRSVRYSQRGQYRPFLRAGTRWRFCFGGVRRRCASGI